MIDAVAGRSRTNPNAQDGQVLSSTAANWLQMIEMKNRRSVLPVLLLLTLLPYSTAEFAEYPVNVSLLIGSETKAVFRCRHQSAFIGWRVNDSSLEQFPNITTSSVNENGARVSMLTIPARSEYNGTEVVCVATFLDGSPPEITPPAMLTIVAATTENMETTTETMATSIAATVAASSTTTEITSSDAATTVMTTAEPTTVTLAGRTTTAPKPTSSVTSFVHVPSPPLVIVTLEERYTYTCNNSKTNRIYWRVNNSRLSVDIFPVKIGPDIIPLPNGHTLHTLTIGGLPEHNETTIQCIAEFVDRSVEETPLVTFLMQGLLQRVSNITRNFTIIMWDVPFSLNLTNADPDIVYCVEVYNTCGRSLLISECDVMETSYTNDALLPGYIYEYTVTPRSNVERASNGTSLNASEIFMWLKLSKRGNRFNVINGSTNSSQVSVQLHLDPHKLSEPAIQVAPASDSVHISLDPLDSHEENETSVMPMVIKGINTYEVTLPYRRLWNYTLLAHGCEEHPITETTELSTHDAQTVLITTTGSPGQVRVTADLIFGSTAIGLLIIIYSLTDDLDIHYHFAQVDQSQVDLNVMGLPGDQYQVLVYVVEENRLPFRRPAITPKSVSISGTDDTQLTSSLNYHVNSTPTGVCITCTHMDISTTDCVAVIHQRISQLSSSELINIKSRRLNRSGENMAYGCIEGVSLTDYQVGVIGVTLTQKVMDNMNEPTQACVACYIVPVMIIVVLSAVLVAVVIYMLFQRRHHHSHPTENPRGDEVKENEYELPSQRPLVRETTPLLEADSSATPITQPLEELPLAPDQGSCTVTPLSLSQPRIEADSFYAVIVMNTSSSSEKIPLPPSTEKVAYHEVKGYKSELGHQYAILAASERASKAPENDSHKTVYSSIDPKSQVPRNVNTVEKQSIPPKRDGPSPIPLTLEHLQPELLPHASKWQSLGEALSLDEDRLDEIYTNNETDEACLQEMLELYLARPDLDHSWEEIQEAVKMIAEELNWSTNTISCTVQQNHTKHSDDSVLQGNELNETENHTEESEIDVMPSQCIH